MPKSILVADDDKSLLDIYRRMFSATDYAITLAATFTEAAGLIEKNDYDLLITDLMFPDGVGTELIRLFGKKKEGAKSMLVTGSASMLESEHLPAVYFEKPFKLDVLLAAVASTLA